MAMTVAGFTGGEAEELRRAHGLQALGEAHGARSRGGCARAWRANGIAGETAGRDRALDHLLRALRLPRVARGVSFALLAYASAYLKAHHPARLRLRAAQQPAHGLLPPVHAGEGRAAPRRALPARGRDAQRLALHAGGRRGAAGAALRARACARRRGSAIVAERRRRPFASLQDFVDRAGLHRDELTALAEVGALNAFGLTRRSALWQVEKAGAAAGRRCCGERRRRTRRRRPSPLPEMTLPSGCTRDIAGTGAHRRARTRGPPPRGAGRARRARAPATCRGSRDGHARARGRRRDLPPAAGHRQGLPVPDPGGRDRPRQHHRAARPLRARTPRCWCAPVLEIDGVLQTEGGLSVRDRAVRPLQVAPMHTTSTTSTDRGTGLQWAGEHRLAGRAAGPGLDGGHDGRADSRQRLHGRVFRPLAGAARRRGLAERPARHRPPARRRILDELHPHRRAVHGGFPSRGPRTRHTAGIARRRD